MHVQMAYAFTPPMLDRIAALSPQIVMMTTFAQQMSATSFNVKIRWIAERAGLHAVMTVLPARRISATCQPATANIKQIVSATLTAAMIMMPLPLTSVSRMERMALV